MKISSREEKISLLSLGCSASLRSGMESSAPDYGSVMTAAV